jgi:hypothetical protein
VIGGPSGVVKQYEIFVPYTNMAAISLFWYTNMAAVTSDENDL